MLVVASVIHYVVTVNVCEYLQPCRQNDILHRLSQLVDAGVLPSLYTAGMIGRSAEMSRNVVAIRVKLR